MVVLVCDMTGIVLLLKLDSSEGLVGGSKRLTAVLSTGPDSNTTIAKSRAPPCNPLTKSSIFHT